MSLFLDPLHHEFQQAFLSHTYLGLSEQDPSKLKQTSTKTIRLTEVFRRAHQEIKNSLQEQNLQDKDILSLKALQDDGSSFYQRYTKATNSWSRWFFKKLAFYTPEFLKDVLPSCFSNQMEQAEKETLAEYEKYRDFIIQKITAFENQKEDIFDPKKDRPIDEKKQPDKENVLNNEEDDLQLQKYLAEFYSQESMLIERKTESKEGLKSQILPIPHSLSPVLMISNEALLLAHFNEHPLTLQKYKNTLRILEIAAKAIDSLENLDLETQGKLEKLGIDSKTFEVLKDPHFKTALEADEDQKILDFLVSTSWGSSFDQALKQKGHIKFGIRKILGNQKNLVLFDDQGKQVKEEVFQKHRGEVHLTIVETTTGLGEVEAFIQFLEKHSSCTPSSLVIHMKEESPLIASFFLLIMKLSQRISEITIEGIQEIDFQKIALSEQEEYSFIQHLAFFQFPHLKNIILSDRSKKDWKVEDFSRLLTLCPNMSLLKECYQHCDSYQDIFLPSAITTIQAVDLKGYSIDQISYLLSQFPNLTSIHLNAVAMTDLQLNTWIKKGYLNNVETLDIKECLFLTTDILHALSRLSQLSVLFLPDLPKGKLSLEILPKFENPFKIQLFYTTSKATQPFAARLYTGPHIWASVFQIPLARRGVSEIFTSDQERLDPKSVAYWLYREDYQYLKPQTNILTVLADSNANLNDDNLTDFMQKFPRTSTLSLYHCPNITEEGIIRLLKTCPNIKTLDLTECSLITTNLFLEDGNFESLKKLKKIILTGTEVSQDIIEIMKETMNVEFEETTLKIFNDDLGNREELMTIQIHPETQLQNCLSYHEKKGLKEPNEEDQRALKQLAVHYIHDRIVAELFCENNELRAVIDTNSKEFCDLTLSFQIDDQSDPVTFQAHQDILCCQSFYFLKGFRAGGLMSKNKHLVFINLHATPNAVQNVMDLFYGKANIENLDWETAADVAELVSQNNFNLARSYYKALLKQIHSQFEVSRAEAMLMAAKLLNDEEGKKKYEETLLLDLENIETSDLENIQKIANLAQCYGLENLKKRVTQIQEKNTYELIKKELQDEAKWIEKKIANETKTELR